VLEEKGYFQNGEQFNSKTVPLFNDRASTMVSTSTPRKSLLCN
jgi:hypothetical protein